MKEWKKSMCCMWGVVGRREERESLRIEEEGRPTLEIQYLVQREREKKIENWGGGKTYLEIQYLVPHWKLLIQLVSSARNHHGQFPWKALLQRELPRFWGKYILHNPLTPCKSDHISNCWKVWSSRINARFIIFSNKRNIWVMECHLQFLIIQIYLE